MCDTLSGADERIHEKHGGKEGLDDFTKNFPQQVSPWLLLFSGKVEKLPFDQEWLMALAAPRPLISGQNMHERSRRSLLLVLVPVHERRLFCRFSTPVCF
jgi:hypothetical protein